MINRNPTKVEQNAETVSSFTPAGHLCVLNDSKLKESLNKY